MAMFDDPKKELAKLEAQLLKEEEWFNRELEQAKALIGEEPAPRKKAAPKSAPAKAAPRQGAKKQPKQAPVPKRKSNKGLVILACLETLGIVGVVAYWLLVLLR